MSRAAEITRTTAETDIRVEIELDGSGNAQIATGVGFFDHMLTLFARHGGFDLTIAAGGDLVTGAHHTVEDVGITLGGAIDRALGDRSGISRYGSAVVPMDECLARAAVDLSGRPYVRCAAPLPPGEIGGFEHELLEEFLRGLANHARLTLHVDVLAPGGVHHTLEACFKAVARALAAAVRRDPRVSGIPSTKGSL